MLTLARDLQGQTQAEAAEMLGISQSMLSKLESGIGNASAELMSAIAQKYRKPMEFFVYSGSIEAPTFVLFRKKANVPPDVQKRFWAKITAATVELKRLLTSTELTTAPLPFIDPDECAGGAAEVALRIRRMWKLPPGPVRNLTQIVENAGCIIIKMDFGTRKIDGCSCFIDGHPTVFVNTELTAVRQRMTIAHELGHLIMHRYPSEDAEDQAFLFAGELQAPGDEIRPMFSPLSLDKLARLKMHWHMAMQALVVHAENLGCIKPSTSRYYFAMMNKRGWKECEPYDDQIKAEVPTLLAEIVGTYLHSLNYTEDQLAKHMLITPQEFTERYKSGSSIFRVVK